MGNNSQAILFRFQCTAAESVRGRRIFITQFEFYSISFSHSLLLHCGEDHIVWIQHWEIDRIFENTKFIICQRHNMRMITDMDDDEKG